MKYLVSIPKGTGPHPVLCFLHGYDEAAPLAIERALMRHGPLNPATPPDVAQRFLVIAPQLGTAGDLWHRHAAEVLRLVEEQTMSQNGDPRRRYLTGFSFGGNGVFDLALAQPGAWTALWAVDPTRVPAEDPRRPVWLSFGAVARVQKERFIHTLALAPYADGAPGGRVWFDGGDDHVGAARRAYADLRIYDWLLAKS